MDYTVLSIEREGHLAIITMNRPERLNALNADLTRELNLALDEVDKEFPQIRAVILTGTGRGFCSGADVTGFPGANGVTANTTVTRAYDPMTSIPPLAPHIRRIAQPVIAAVNGVATGAGLALSLACDIRIASTEARFASIFVKRSLVPDTGSSVSLPDLVGYGIASEMAYTGRVMDAQWALEKGLVNRVVPPDQLLDAAKALGNEIAANPPLAVRAAKGLMYRCQSLEEAIPNEGAANYPSLNSEDRLESARAFFEKRQPTFRGH